MAATEDKRRKSEKFARLNTLITREAKERIRYARILRQQSTVSRISEGQIIVDLATEHLDAVPPGAMNGLGKKRPTAAKRGAKDRRGA